MLQVAIVLVARELEKIGIDQQIRALLDGPRRGVGAGIVDRDLDLEGRRTGA